MAVGQGALISGLGYVACARETTLGTYATCTTALDVLSFSMKTARESKVVEEITRSRVHNKQITLSKSLEGEAEVYFYPDHTSCMWLLQNAFAGSITSAAVSAGTSYTHTYELGSYPATYTSMCFNVRYGDTTGGKVFQYQGVRFNEFSMKAELDEGVKTTVAMVGIDSTTLSNDVSAALTLSSAAPFTFVGGRFSVDGSLASLTSSTFWHIQSAEFKLTNNLKTDTESRRIGSDVLGIIPLGVANIEMNVEMRFDTTTAFDSMIAGTGYACEIEFEGVTITGSTLKKTLTIQCPKVYIVEASEPEIGGPDEILKSSVMLRALKDDSSSGGYAVQAVLQNGISAI